MNRISLSELLRDDKNLLCDLNIVQYYFTSFNSLNKWVNEVKV